MIDPVLDEEAEAIRALVASWEQLVARIRASRGGKPGDEGAEKEFREARSEWVGKYAALMDRLEVARGEGDEPLGFLGRAGLLQSVSALPELQWKKAEETCAHIEVGLQSLLGLVEERRRRILPVNRGLLRLRDVLLCWPLKLLYLTLGILIIFLVMRRVLV